MPVSAIKLKADIISAAKAAIATAIPKPVFGVETADGSVKLKQTGVTKPSLNPEQLDAIAEGVANAVVAHLTQPGLVDVLVVVPGVQLGAGAVTLTAKGNIT